MTVFSIILVGLHVSAALFGLYRVFAGPKDLDRVLALDFLSIVGMGVTIVLAAVTEEPLVLDIGLCFALVGFLTAYVFSLYLPKEDN